MADTEFHLLLPAPESSKGASPPHLQPGEQPEGATVKACAARKVPQEGSLEAWYRGAAQGWVPDGRTVPITLEGGSVFLLWLLGTQEPPYCAFH